ncbi:9858_t:CDS:1, partial [Entrophospora sp. SA101]
EIKKGKDNAKIDHKNYQKQIKVQKKEIQKLKTKTQEVRT